MLGTIAGDVIGSRMQLGYDLSRTLGDCHPTRHLTRGGADTQAAITGGIAAAFYGEVPDKSAVEVIARLPGEFRDLMAEPK